MLRLSQDIFEVLETRYLSALISYKGNDRIETSPYPEQALREAIFNSLMHTDWAVGEPIRIRVFKDSLDISNRAVLQAEWSVDEHRSFQLNPLISEAFEKAGFVEKFGTGISKILSACKANGNNVPVFDVTSNGKEMTVTFSASKLYLAIEKYREKIDPKTGFVDYNKVVSMLHADEIEINVNKIDTNSIESEINDVESDTNNIESDTNDNLHAISSSNRYRSTLENCTRVFQLIKEKPTITYTQLASELLLSRSTVIRAIGILKDDGYIHAKGNTRAREWETLKEYPNE